MIKIAISARITDAAGYVEPRNTLALDWNGFFSAIGALPVIIPNGFDHVPDYFDAFDFHGVILSGGNNVSPKLYGSDDELGDVYEERDRTEEEMIKECLKRNIPLVGVCRGMHMINVFFGGSLVHGIPGHVAVRHKSAVNCFTHILGRELETNSFHNQGIIPETLAANLTPFAMADDDMVEAFYHNESRILGLQWHPERDLAETGSIALISKFFTGEF